MYVATAPATSPASTSTAHLCCCTSWSPKPQWLSAPAPPVLSLGTRMQLQVAKIYASKNRETRRDSMRCVIAIGSHWETMKNRDTECVQFIRSVRGKTLEALVFAKLCQGQDCDPSGLQNCWPCLVRRWMTMDELLLRICARLKRSWSNMIKLYQTIM